MNIEDLLSGAMGYGASDVHVVAGLPPAVRIDGEVIFMDCDPLKPQETKELAYSLLNSQQREKLEADLELCHSTVLEGIGRFRVAAYYRNGNPELAIRLCPNKVKSARELNLPPIVDELTRRTRGLVLITGATGMGKSTTLNYMIDLINMERRCKIVTIEDPVEYVHAHKKSIVVQQEVHTDTLSFARALVHVLRQDPDVIGIGEMRDMETTATALTAAETGHLVIATLHTPDAVQTIDRIIDIFPPQQQSQIVSQLALSLGAVVAQHLLPRVDTTGRILASEVLVATDAVRNVIKEKKIEQLYNIMQTGGKLQMRTMDDSVRELYEKGIITYDTAISRLRNKKLLEKGKKE